LDGLRNNLIVHANALGRELQRHTIPLDSFKYNSSVIPQRWIGTDQSLAILLHCR